MSGRRAEWSQSGCRCGVGLDAVAVVFVGDCCCRIWCLIWIICPATVLMFWMIMMAKYRCISEQSIDTASDEEAP